MEEELYTGLNPWHYAVCLDLGFICRRCSYFFQGEEEWRRDILSFDPHRWFVMIANAAREAGWKRNPDKGFLCPKCVSAIKRRKQRDD